MWRLTLFLVSISSTWAASGSWNYNRSDPTYGPDGWASLPGSACGGWSNSPIDLNTSSSSTPEPWTISGWNSPSRWNISDKQYTVQFTLASGEMTLAGGGLSTEYKLVQFHFHWGSANAAGSEHTVKGGYYPLEIHFVHMKSEFSSLGNALASMDFDALAVIGIFFEIVSEDNSNLESLIDGVRLTQNGNVSSDLFNLGKLNSFAGEPMKDGFWRYHGGLTTPTCNEHVVWTVMKEPIGISANQMAAFRMIDNGDYGMELYRPVVPLGNRTLTYYKAGGGTETGDGRDPGGNASSSLPSLALMAAMMAMMSF